MFAYFILDKYVRLYENWRSKQVKERTILPQGAYIDVRNQGNIVRDTEMRRLSDSLNEKKRGRPRLFSPLRIIPP